MLHPDGQSAQEAKKQAAKGVDLIKVEFFLSVLWRWSSRKRSGNGSYLIIHSCDWLWNILGLENISMTISSVFLLPGWGAFGESCSTLDGMVGMQAAIAERFREWKQHWSPCCTEGSQVPTGTKQPPLSVGTFSSGLEKGRCQEA